MRHHKRFFLILCWVSLFFWSGCGGPGNPLPGTQDYGILGVGVAEEIRVAVPAADLVWVYGIPGASGYGQKLQQDFVKQLASELKSEGMKVEPVRYQDEEIQAYHSGRYTTLHPSFALPPLQRAGQVPDVVVSLMGWPAGPQKLFPDSTLFVNISWSAPASQRSGNHTGSTISIAAKDGKRPEVSAGSSREALESYHKLFHSERRLP